MNRKTAVGLCTLWLAIGCGEQDDAANGVDRAQPSTTAAQEASAAERSISGPVRGTYDGKPFEAVVTVTEFVVENGALNAVGKLGSIVGELAEGTNKALQAETHRFRVLIGPVVRPQVVVMADAGTPGAADAGLATICDVLYLSLAPLRAEVQGLPLDLDTVSLEVEHDADAGDQAGRLLCTVASLIDPAGTLGGPTPQNLQRAVELLDTLLKGHPDAPSVDAGAELPATDAGRNPAASVDASVPIRF